MNTSVVKEAFDPAALRQRYDEERVKRLRSDGNEQYQEMKGDFSYLRSENKLFYDPI